MPPSFRLLPCLVLLAPVAGLASCAEDGPSIQECTDIIFETDDLKREMSLCSPGDTCIIVQMEELAGSSCASIFHCPIAVNSNVDLDAYGAKLTALNNAHKECDVCSEPTCINPQDLEPYCDVDPINGGSCVVDVDGDLCSQLDHWCHSI